MNTYNEKEIIALLQDPARQKEAFECIVNEYSEQLYWQIRRMVLSHEDANDLLQNTFIKAWTNLEYFRAEAKMSTWLYRIALNECLTFLNKQRATNQLSIDDADADMVNKLESDTYFNGDETQILFQKALLTLPEKQRIVFNLKYFQEMKYEDMSEILGTSIGALKASYHHAVKKIENFLKDELQLELSKFRIAKIKQGCNFVGFRTWKRVKFIRKHTLHNFSKAVKLQKEASIISILGHAKHSSSHKYLISKIGAA